MNKQYILGQLEPFKGDTRVIVYDQSTNDIIKGILHTHNKYVSEYDKIFPYFISQNLYNTCRKVFAFLKKNVPYYIESEHKQYLKSPAGILETESDCKSYALFSCGVMSALQRNLNEDFTVCYRFASYQLFNKNYQHVFCVIKTNDGHEIWIDPVLQNFDEKKEPYYFEDREIKNKVGAVGSLIAMSGVDQSTLQLEGAASLTADAILPGSGQILSVAAGLLNSIFPGHSNLYYWNQARKSNQYGQAIQYLKMVQQEWQNSIDTMIMRIATSGSQEDRDGIQQLPQIYIATHDPYILQCYKSAVAQNYLQPNSTVQSLLAPIQNVSAPGVNVSSNNLLYIGIGLAALIYLSK